MGDDPSILDEETNRDIQKMRCVWVHFPLCLKGRCESQLPAPDAVAMQCCSQ